jgi:hypothetical protein
MATVKEQMMLKAVSDYCKTHESFRNRHLMTLTGLSRQDINHYLNKWRDKGFVTKSPLVHGEWILYDLPGLIADLVEPTEPAKMGHAKHELFDKEVLTRLQNIIEVYAALRSLKLRDVKIKDMIETYINNAIDELRNERVYMNVKQFSPDRARQMLLKHEAYARDMGIDIDKIVGLGSKPQLTLVADRKESDGTGE